MEIRKWLSNSKEVLATIPKDRLSSIAVNIFEESAATSKTLGLMYDASTCSDTICFTVSALIDFSRESCTKRNTLRIIARIFEVLGYLDPFLMVSKILSAHLGFRCRLG